MGQALRTFAGGSAKVRCKNTKGVFSSQWIEAKLDSCGSVSLSHSKYLTEIKPCKEYKLPMVTLKGIGGKTQPLQKAGVLKVIKPDNRI